MVHLPVESHKVKVSDSGMSVWQQTLPLPHTSVLWGQRATDDSSIKWPPGHTPPTKKSLWQAVVSLNLCFLFSGDVTLSNPHFRLIYYFVADWNPTTVTASHNLAKHKGSCIIISHEKGFSLSNFLNNDHLSAIIHSKLIHYTGTITDWSVSPHQFENNPPHLRVKWP